MTDPKVPPRYYWLWHLAALGVIDADFGPVPGIVPDPHESAVRPVPAPEIRGTVWDRIAAQGPSHATAALIDTGVSRAHPNLKSRVDADRSIDLTSHRYGSRTRPAAPGTTPFTRESRQAFYGDLSLAGLGQLHLDAGDQDFFEALVEELCGSQGAIRHLTDAEETFAAHGTACAGLIVGEPAAVAQAGETAQQPPETVLQGGAINPDANLLPYFGADPFSTLISVRTSFESDPYQFIAAFLYAWAQKVDVIILPRGLPDPTRSRLAPKNDLKAYLETWQNRTAADLYTRLNAYGAERPDPVAAQDGHRPDRPWKILKHLIVAISRHIPVVCAAGNDGESQLIYPACLADDSNGIIAVGAVTAEGLRAGYANYGEGLTLVAPSDDYGVYNRHQMRLNRADPLVAMHDYSVGAGAEYVYCPMELVTTDLPGVFGYDSGTAPWSSVLPGHGASGFGGGYYTAFGGTSGAASLVGGLALLAQRARRAAGRSTLDGPSLKTMLVTACSRQAIVAPGFRPLTPDAMNQDDEPGLGPAHFFGAGLPDASALVTAALVP